MTSSEQQQLLLSAALCDEPEAFAAWQSFQRSSPDLRALDEAAVRLLPQVYLNLRDSGVAGELRGGYLQTSYDNQVLFERAGTVVELLGGAGIPTIVFKGAAVCIRYHGDHGARPMADADVLVPPDRVSEADRTLRQAGWQRSRAADHAIEVPMSIKHGVGYAGPGGGKIDLHWCPLHEPVDTGPFWSHAEPAILGSADTLAMNPADELLVICAHGLLGERSHRWMADVVVLVRAAGETLDWDLFVDHAERCRLTARMHHALGLIDGRFDVHVPPRVLVALSAARRPLHERVAQVALRRRPRRGLTTVLYWDRHRRRRALGAPGSEVGFLRWLRDMTEAPRWRDLPIRYRRAYHARQAQPADPERRPHYDQM
jgi:hypothetical protein